MLMVRSPGGVGASDDEAERSLRGSRSGVVSTTLCDDFDCVALVASVMPGKANTFVSSLVAVANRALSASAANNSSFSCSRDALRWFVSSSFK